jgi:hypothetical protein
LKVPGRGTLVKKNILFFVGCAVLCLLFGSISAAQTTITFDDLNPSPSGTLIANGYSGFDWINFYAINPSTFGATNGYTNGLVSSPNVAFNGGGIAANLSSTSPFTFNSAYFNAAWNNGLSITVTGFLSGVQEDTLTFIVNSTGPSTLETFNWSNINELTFVSTGGTNAGFNGSGTQFVLDNLEFNQQVSPTPEPPAFFLFLGGILFIGIKLLKSR